MRHFLFLENPAITTTCHLAFITIKSQNKLSSHPLSSLPLCSSITSFGEHLLHLLYFFWYFSSFFLLNVRLDSSSMSATSVVKMYSSTFLLNSTLFGYGEISLWWLTCIQVRQFHNTRSLLVLCIKNLKITDSYKFWYTIMHSSYFEKYY